MLNNEKMIMIGSSGRNSGKTTLSVELIKKYKNANKVVALKVTTIGSRKLSCPRGGEGCGVCTSLQGEFDIREEVLSGKVKDTQRLKEAGANRVFWIRAYKENLEDAYLAFEKLGLDYDLLITESNSLRNILKPGFFLMIKNTPEDKMKETSKEVIGLADLVVEDIDQETRLILDKKIDEIIKG